MQVRWSSLVRWKQATSCDTCVLSFFLSLVPYFFLSISLLPSFIPNFYLFFIFSPTSCLSSVYFYIFLRHCFPFFPLIPSFRPSLLLSSIIHHTFFHWTVILLFFKLSFLLSFISQSSLKLLCKVQLHSATIFKIFNIIRYQYMETTNQLKQKKFKQKYTINRLFKHQIARIVIYVFSPHHPLSLFVRAWVYVQCRR